ncbi:MAG: hypothetical protein Q8N90_04420 [bacterium]|nr:hypothetical protein [bacterium]
MKIAKIFLTASILFVLSQSTAWAADATCYTLEVPLGTFTQACGPAEYLTKIYTISVGVAVALAVVMIVYAGIIYTTSGDNASKQKEAKTQITQAIFGLAILLASYLILNTINPDLVNLGLIQSRIQGKAGGIDIALPPGANVPSEFCALCTSGASESYDKCIAKAANNSKNSDSSNYEKMKTSCETKKQECLNYYQCGFSGSGGGSGGGGASGGW